MYNFESNDRNKKRTENFKFTVRQKSS